MEAECSAPRSDSGRAVSSYEHFMIFFYAGNVLCQAFGESKVFIWRELENPIDVAPCWQVATRM